jgi:hypothetical protein
MAKEQFLEVTVQRPDIQGGLELATLAPGRGRPQARIAQHMGRVFA